MRAVAYIVCVGGWHTVDSVVKGREEIGFKVGTGLQFREGTSVVLKTYLQLSGEETSWQD